ncbi:MAG: ABC transporter permease [Candidatus Eisenbacteria bacterium]|nr:ABC transporter permease [Candidatus Eisenbacteria bacterium]
MRAILGNVSYRAAYVWRRNVDVYLTTWATNFLPPLLEPFQYLLAFGLGLGGAVGVLHFRGLPVPYMNFIAPGTISIAIMFWAFFETTYSSYVRMYYQKTFDAITATPLTIEDVIAGELLWGTTKSLVAASIMLLVLSFFGFVAFPSGLWVIPVAVVGGLFFASFGMIATSLVPTIEVFNLPIFLMVFPMFVFGGTFFPIENLPSWARWISTALPLTHVSRLVRASMLDRLVIMDLAVGAGLAVAAVAAAVASIALMRRRLVK